MFCKWSAALALTVSAASAEAVCVHNGTLYAKTTLAQEFAESRWVVRARVESGRSSFGESGSWTLYRLRLIHAFKGAPPAHFRFYTRRDSGGFYLDSRRGGPDVGQDYLLFLNPGEAAAGEDPPVARGARWVNYECGASKPWKDVNAIERRRLSALERRRRR
jgi:hypothetical protein